MPQSADMIGQATDVVIVALCSAVQAGADIDEILPDAVREAVNALAPRGFQGDSAEIADTLQRTGRAMLAEAAR